MATPDWNESADLMRRGDPDGSGFYGFAHVATGTLADMVRQAFLQPEADRARIVIESLGGSLHWPDIAALADSDAFPKR